MCVDVCMCVAWIISVISARTHVCLLLVYVYVSVWCTRVQCLTGTHVCVRVHICQVGLTWQNWHQGAYSTASVPLSRLPEAISRICVGG